MKIRQVKAFLAVVKTGSVRRASVELNLTQSTVAKAVSQLEAELGSPLFERSAQGLRLNEPVKVFCHMRKPLSPMPTRLPQQSQP